jgi:hypothetical protein
VLKKCIYRYVTLEGGGLPAQWLKLPTAGSKALHCVKSNQSMLGLVLDDLDGHFDNIIC